MNGYLQAAVVRPGEELVDSIVPRAFLLRRLLARRRARRLEHTRRARDQRFAWRAQEIIVGCGLIQDVDSIAGGRTVRIPDVISVIAGPPRSLDIRILPGQTPEDFDARTPALAYSFGVAKVSVVPLAPSLIRLQLLPE
jgi:S-DNA-T family DNA segregation ATPase FtsK/SpoIIIE